MWYRCKATCTHWLIDIMGCRVARRTPPPPHRSPGFTSVVMGAYCENKPSQTRFSFPGRVAGLIGRWLLATQDSFNKNTSRFTLIIHRPRSPSRLPPGQLSGAAALMKVQSGARISLSIASVRPSAGVLQSRCFSAT